MEVEKISNSPEETFNIAKELASKITPSCLIGLSGELGVGKTVFAKGFASGLGVKELVTSPTFLGISESYSGRYPFIHVDFYQKVSKEEIIKAYLNKNSVVLIEWIENFESIFGEKLTADISVYIHYLKNDNADFIETARLILIKEN